MLVRSVRSLRIARGRILGNVKGSVHQCRIVRAPVYYFSSNTISEGKSRSKRMIKVPMSSMPQLDAHDALLHRLRQLRTTDAILDAYMDYKGSNGRMLPPVMRVFVLHRLSRVIYYHVEQGLHNFFIKEKNDVNSKWDTSQTEWDPNRPPPAESAGKDVHLDEHALHADHRFKKLVKDVIGGVHGLNPNELGRLFMAIGKLRYDDGALVQPAIDLVRANLRNFPEKYKKRDLIHIMAGLADLNVRPPALLTLLMELTVKRAATDPLATQEMVDCLTIMSDLNFPNKAFLRYLRDVVVERFDELNTEEMFECGACFQEMNFPTTALAEKMNAINPLRGLPKTAIKSRKGRQKAVATARQRRQNQPKRGYDPLAPGPG